MHQGCRRVEAGSSYYHIVCKVYRCGQCRTVFRAYDPRVVANLPNVCQVAMPCVFDTKLAYDVKRALLPNEVSAPKLVG